MATKERAKREPAVKPYSEGYRAFQDGVAMDANPYKGGGTGGTNHNRTDWFSGWLDSKFEQKWPGWSEL